MQARKAALEAERANLEAAVAGPVTDFFAEPFLPAGRWRR
jgi:hypothetical protein